MECFPTLGGRFFRISKNLMDQFSQWTFFTWTLLSIMAASRHHWHTYYADNIRKTE